MDTVGQTGGIGGTARKNFILITKKRQYELGFSITFFHQEKIIETHRATSICDGIHV